MAHGVPGCRGVDHDHQYLEWPDMNVPNDPRGVLGLIQEVERAVEETGSAGGESAEPRWSCGNDSDPATHSSAIQLPCSPTIHLHQSQDIADASPSIQDWPVASAQSAGCSQGQQKPATSLYGGLSRPPIHPSMPVPGRALVLNTIFKRVGNGSLKTVDRGR